MVKKRLAVRRYRLILRCIAFNAIVLLLIWFDCLSSIISGFRRALVGVRDVCCVAFPLIMPCKA